MNYHCLLYSNRTITNQACDSPKCFMEKYLSSYSSLKPQHSTSTFLRFANIVRLLKKKLGKMEVAELKMVRWALGVTRKNKIRNEYVRGTAKIAKLGDKLRNARLRWYGHVKRREEGYVGKTMMEMAVPGRRKRGRPRRRWIDLTREDMERDGAKEGDEVDREKWKIPSRCGHPE